MPTHYRPEDHPLPRELSGILIIDKPAGMTSAKVVSRVKKITRAEKIGHTGTLDPFATGVLICCLNRATRLAGFFLHGDKTYEGVLFLGKETDTQDATGKTVSTSGNILFSEQDIMAAFAGFKGTFKQQPPVYSALKHQGTPLYKLARNGNPVQKPPRQVHISELSVLHIDLPEVRFRVSCSAGTYIRTLCSDIGRILGCGGHLKTLRRLQSCGFEISRAITLETLEKLAITGKLSDNLITMNEALKDMPAYISDDVLTEKICHGQPISEKDLENKPFMENLTDSSRGYIKIIDQDQNLLAVVNHKKSEKPYKYCCVFPYEIE